MEAAIQLSWDDISTGSQRVAMLLGLFAPVEIFWELVAWIGASAEITEVELNEARGQLDSLHLIQPIDEECNFYKIHTLVREFFRAKLLKAEENHQFRQAFVTSLLAIAKEIPQSPTRDLIARVSPAIPHLDMLSREMLGDIPNPEEDLYLAFTGTAWFYSGQGLYELAEDPYQRCLNATQELLGDRHPFVAVSFNNLAVLYKSQGRYAEAEQLYQKSLQLMREIFGDRHLSVATSLNNLAELYHLQGRYAEAEQIHQESLQLMREIFGDRHPSVATSLNNLAALYEAQGRYAEAEQLRLQCLDIERETLGEKHPQFASSLNNLALLYEAQGRYTEAEQLYQESLQLRREVLGNRHPDVATSLNNLAELYHMQGRYAKVEPLYQEALEILMTTVGENHPYTKSVRVALIMLKLQAITGLDAADLKQMIQNNPDALMRLLQQ